MVECEFWNSRDFKTNISSFNRYMVECEYFMTVVDTVITTSFNRYMVECECILMKKSSQIMIVLIDTWWNVNCITRSSFPNLGRF